MVLEVAIMNVKVDKMAEFEAAFPKAAALSKSTPGCISVEMQRCIETKGRYFYMLRWENLEAHTVTWANSPQRAEFRKLMSDFWVELPQTQHFEAVTNDRI